MEDRWGNLSDDDYNNEGDDIWQSDEEDYTEEQQTTAEVKAFERTGGAMAGGVLIGGPKSRKDYANQDKTEQFSERLDAISRSLDSNPGITIGEDDREAMIRRARTVQNIEHLNPTAFILGYMATNGGRNMEVDRVREVIQKVLPQAGTESVQPPDVVRYARFWSSN